VQYIASTLCAILILVLFRLDRESQRRTSVALWAPVTWLLIAGSRNVGEWLQLGEQTNAVDRYMEGNAIDRNILSVLMLCGLITLLRRRQHVGSMLRENTPLMAYFLYCGVSLLWSDYAFVGTKRWFRSLGDVIMVLVILTEPDWHATVKRVLSHMAFVLLPVSVLLIRYYPDLGRAYGIDGSQYSAGVTTGKNSLGMICLIFGLACLWTFLDLYQAKGGTKRSRRLTAHAIVVCVAIYLLWIANSQTSLMCFVMVSSLIGVTYCAPWAQRPAFLRVTMIATVSVCFAVLFLGIGSGALEAIGRNSTLTGRTDVWKVVLQYVTHPMIGAGYESFWMGSRLATIRASNAGVNQAHNGYIEIYLNLGWIGVGLFAVLLINGYRKVMDAFRCDPKVGRIRVAYFVVAVMYNFTEGTFKMMSPVWISFLLAIMPRSRVQHQENPTPTLTADEGPT